MFVDMLPVCVPPGVRVKDEEREVGMAGVRVEGERGRKRIRWSRAGTGRVIFGLVW